MKEKTCKLHPECKNCKRIGIHLDKDGNENTCHRAFAPLKK